MSNLQDEFEELHETLAEAINRIDLRSTIDQIAESESEEKEYMEENVMIEVNSRQLVEGEEQEINLMSKGVYYVDEKGYHIEYEETEATGFQGATSSITYEPRFDRVTMERDGENPTNIIIDKNKRHLCNYGTPYGMLTIGVRGCKIKSDLSSEGGTISFTYTLDVNTALASTNTINIKIIKEK